MKISYDYTVISLKFVYFYWKKFESSWQVILFQIVRKKKKEWEARIQQFRIADFREHVRKDNLKSGDPSPAGCSASFPLHLG